MKAILIITAGTFSPVQDKLVSSYTSHTHIRDVFDKENLKVAYDGLFLKMEQVRRQPGLSFKPISSTVVTAQLDVIPHS